MHREYVKGDYEKYICFLTKENMSELFISNFGGWSDDVSKKKFFDVLSKGHVELFFLKEEFILFIAYEYS